MRFTLAAATVMTMATTVMGVSWKPFGGDLSFVGPTFNATFKAGDTIPLEYVFSTIRTATNSTNSTAQGIATLTSLAWIGATGNQTLQVAFDNNRASEYSAPCMPTDSCTGTYYPKRINLVVPANTYLSNYTIEIGYTLLQVSNFSMFYREPVTIVAASTNMTSPGPVYPGAPQVSVTLPVYSAPKGSSAAMTQVPKAVVGLAAIAISAVLML